MLRNSVQGFANTLVEMAVAAGSAALYLAVADLRDGTVVVDLLSRTACLDGEALPTNAAVERLSDWLHARASRTRATTPASLLEARLTLLVDSHSIPTARDHLLFFRVDAACSIATQKWSTTATAPPAAFWLHR